MDLLSEVLAVSGVRGVVGTQLQAGQDWGYWFASQAPRAALHAVTSGTAWLGLPGQPPLQLMPGDVVLLPDGAEHVLGSGAEAVSRTGPRSYDDWHTTGSGAVRIGAEPVRAHILCAHYGHDAAVSTQVLASLPSLLHLRSSPDGGQLEDTVRLLGRELARPQIATSIVLERLVDVLLVQALREWLAGNPVREPCWLGVLCDDIVAAAATLLHSNPARAWTAGVLAREIGVSRSTLSRRFAVVTGETPGTYLTRWRMDLAARRLRDTDDSLEAVAHSVGYTSVYAFSRAFSRLRSEPPGQYRTRARSVA
ncbi:AraC family transcriptional regulator [Actinoallomurus iriomotensis]|uniref:AraC family transcriptional regulator n=1 Tax=Actinoallomurus iriomotensis TaxID=478107 RepID=A0A9W6W4J2_9ACTN|nr:AraC family transcriptional regulator [Actinoallomurus iriomotensis]GLY90534.1 AraC family transcriptional regulator [Actinoallomurus iriomotensis]